MHAHVEADECRAKEEQGPKKSPTMELRLDPVLGMAITDAGAFNNR